MSLLLAAIPAVASLASSVFGGIKSGQYNDKADRLLAQQRANNRRWYDIRRSEDFTRRADVQAAINKQRELLDEQYKRARAVNTVAGGTEESLARQKEAANRTVADTMSDVAVKAAESKDRVEDRYLEMENALMAQERQSAQQQAAATAQAAGQAVSSGISLAGTLASLAQQKKKTP